MDAVVMIVRVILPFVGLLVLFLVRKLCKPPKEIFSLALRFCWVAGLVNLAVDIIEEHFGFWHYTAKHLIFGFPFDLYIAVSFVIGAAIPILFWWLKSFHKKWVFPTILILNIYFMFEDAAVFKLGGSAAGIQDSQYWWIADFFSIAAIIWISIFVFNYFLKQKRLPSSVSTE